MSTLSVWYMDRLCLVTAAVNISTKKVYNPQQYIN